MRKNEVAEKKRQPAAESKTWILTYGQRWKFILYMRTTSLGETIFLTTDPTESRTA